MQDLQIARAEPGQLDQLATIYNHAVVNTTATFDLAPRDRTYFEKWWDTHQDSTFGVFSATLGGAVVGYATLSTLTPREGYRVSAEVSVYVHPDHQGRGVGRKLSEFAIAHGRRSGLYSLLAIITATNASSLDLFRSLGFVKTGEMNAVAKKMSQVLDLHIHQVFFPENVRRGGAAIERTPIPEYPAS